MKIALWINGIEESRSKLLFIVKPQQIADSSMRKEQSSQQNTEINGDLHKKEGNWTLISHNIQKYLKGYLAGSVR